MNKVLRIAVAGAGPRANDYMTAIVKLSDIYDFCAVCDKDEERAHLAANRHAVSRHSGQQGAAANGGSI